MRRCNGNGWMMMSGRGVKNGKRGLINRVMRGMERRERGNEVSGLGNGKEGILKWGWL